jgi:hypothetical protein
VVVALLGGDADEAGLFEQKLRGLRLHHAARGAVLQLDVLPEPRRVVVAHLFGREHK